MTQPNSTHKTTTPVKVTHVKRRKRPTKRQQFQVHLIGSTPRQLFPAGYETPPRSNQSECPECPTKRQRPLFGSTTGELPDGYQTPLRRNKSDHQIPSQPFLTFPPFPFPSLD